MAHLHDLGVTQNYDSNWGRKKDRSQREKNQQRVVLEGFTEEVGIELVLNGWLVLEQLERTEGRCCRCGTRRIKCGGE